MSGPGRLRQRARPKRIALDLGSIPSRSILRYLRRRYAWALDFEAQRQAVLEEIAHQSEQMALKEMHHPEKAHNHGQSGAQSDVHHPEVVDVIPSTGEINDH